MKIQCPYCKNEIEVSEKVIYEDKYIQCPICGAMINNKYSTK